MISQDELRTVIGATAYDSDGDKIGKVGQVYFDDNTDQPKWITVNTGLFGTGESFVPLQGASVSGDRVTVGFDKGRVKDAPNVEGEGHLSVEEEQRLYEYYGLDYSGAGYQEQGGVDSGRHASGYSEETRTETTTGRTGADYTDTTTGRTGGDYTEGVERSAGHDTSGPNTDDAMTRSEERLNVGTETREAGRARLRKHVVTEQQQVSVPVSREELTVEREPITDGNRGSAYDGAAIKEEEHEVVLREERPVVEKEAVAVERVRLGTETRTSEETVSGEVRKEEIELDDDTRRDRLDDDTRGDRR